MSGRHSAPGSRHSAPRNARVTVAGPGTNRGWGAAPSPTAGAPKSNPRTGAAGRRPAPGASAGPSRGASTSRPSGEPSSPVSPAALRPAVSAAASSSAASSAATAEEVLEGEALRLRIKGIVEEVGRGVTSLEVELAAIAASPNLAFVIGQYITQATINAKSEDRAAISKTLIDAMATPHVDAKETLAGVMRVAEEAARLAADGPKIPQFIGEVSAAWRSSSHGLCCCHTRERESERRACSI